jgi:hypothetical protein
MGLKRAAAWPVLRVSRWVDDRPLSAVGALLAVGSFLVLFASAGVAVDPTGPALAYEDLTPRSAWRALLEQPAYTLAGALGSVLVVFYDG